MPAPSIKSRFAVAFFFNLFRGALSFATGLLIARGLGPEKYGDFVFLLGSFIALRQILDLGTSNAFFTLISQKPRGRNFLVAYGLWELLQLFLPLLVIGFLFTDDLRDLIWLGHDRTLIMIAFVSVFMREQAWKTMVQIGESGRLTYRVHIFDFVIGATHFLLVISLWLFDNLSVMSLFGLIMLEYLVAVTVAMNRFNLERFEKNPLDWKDMFEEYRSFCSPLILLSIAAFIYGFADRWLLQSFGGSREQGFYGVGYQFSVIILLATTSLYKIFWKEIAEAQENGDVDRVHFLYKKVCRFLFMSGAALCGLLMPWASIIVKFALGESYIESTSILAIMFLFPVHQALGHIATTLLLATGRTRATIYLQCAILIVSLPVTYFVLAPTDAWLPGLSMGSLGMAWKMVILGIIGVNLIIWQIDKNNGWEFDWVYQVVGLSVTLPLGLLGHFLADEVSQALSLNLFWNFGVNVFWYSIFIISFFWKFPELAGMTNDEIKKYLAQVRQIIAKRKIFHNS